MNNWVASWLWYALDWEQFQLGLKQDEATLRDGRRQGWEKGGSGTAQSEGNKKDASVWTHGANQE